MESQSPFQAAADALAAQDEKLAVAIAAVGPCRLVPADRPPYEALLNAIAHQQVHGAAAKAILGRMHALYARDGGAPRWPTPQELHDTPEDTLRGVGLSRSKVLAMRDVAAKTLDGTVPDLATIACLSNDEIVERLVAVRGVGRWTAEMLLIFTLGRPDVLPVDDYGVRYGFQLLHRKRKMPPPKWLAKYGERWSPHRSTVAWYMWRYVDWVRANGLEPRRARAKATKVARANARGAKAAVGKAADAKAAKPAGSGARAKGKAPKVVRVAKASRLAKVAGAGTGRASVKARAVRVAKAAGAAVRKAAGTVVRTAAVAARARPGASRRRGR